MPERPDDGWIDDSLLDELRGEFAAKCGSDLDELCRAAEAGDWAAVAAVAHDVKGTAPVFGYGAAGETARRLEAAARAQSGPEVSALIGELAGQLPPPCTPAKE